MFYYYSKDRSLNGTLRSFFDDGTLYSNIEIHATSISENDSKFDPKNPFNYTTNDYWIGDSSQEGLINLTFCLKNHFVKTYGFEIGTTEFASRPAEFMFSSSFDNFSEYTAPISYSHEFNLSDILYFSYRSKPSKCFRYTSIKNVDNIVATDVRYIELWGEIHESLSQFRSYSCATAQHSFRLSLIFFAITLK